MELVEGGTLADLICAGGLSVPQFLEIALQMTDALAAAHQKQITHRDLKPGNVMISTDGRVKVLDFGLARVGPTEDIEQTMAPLTRQGVILGTMPYMSPEQVEGRVLDPRSDLFSLGIIFYEMLNGERPFKGESSPALITAILRDTPSSVGVTRRDVPLKLCQLIDLLLQKQPDARPQSAHEVGQVLKQLHRALDTGTVAMEPMVLSHATTDAHRSRPSSSPSSMRDSIGVEISIAVRPFRGGSQPETASIADGLTSDIATRLARFAYLRVLTPAAIEQHPVPAGERYGVEGEVRSSGTVIRISARLINLATSMQMWAQNYDREATTSAFEILDDVADRIAATIADNAGELMRALAADSSAGTNTPMVQFTAYGQNFTPEAHARLMAAFEAIVEAEPEHSSAWGYLSVLCSHEVLLGFNPRPDPIGRARRASERAIAIENSNQRAWYAHAMAAFLDHDETAFRSAAERAIELNPLSSVTLATIGMFSCYSGHTARGAELIRKAMTLTPHHPGWYHTVLFADAFMTGDAERALTHASLVTLPHLSTAGLFATAAAGRFARKDQARLGIETWMRANEGKPFDLEHLRKIMLRFLWEGPLLDAMMDGLSKARDLAGIAPVATEASIAVLPFSDLSEKKDQDWFCDGIAEEILNALAPLPGLRVAARASTFSLRDKSADLKSIGEKLDVQTVLEGSVRRAGDRVRITAQLSDTQQGRQMWSERFDRELKDIFDVQEEIARSIVDRLRVTLIDGGRLVEKRTGNLEAYELLLKGRVLVTRRGRAVAEAIECFERAVQLDPNLSEAHALLGDAYRLLCVYGIARARETMPKSRAAVERALAIEPNQPEALAAFAIIAVIYEWNLDELIRRSDRALAVDPLHVRALAERAIAMGAFKDYPKEGERPAALDFIARARKADPLNAWVLAMETAVLTMVGRSADAIETGRHGIQLDPSNFSAHWFYVSALAAEGRIDEALAAAAPALALSGRHTMILTIVSSIHASRGNVAEVEAIRAELLERAKTSFIGEGALACVAAAAGRWEEARAYLRTAITERDPYLTFWKLYAWRPVWEDAECAALLRATSIFDELRSQ
jgi:TolB-like protein